MPDAPVRAMAMVLGEGADEVKAESWQEGVITTDG
jgi:hypothetical protein